MTLAARVDLGFGVMRMRKEMETWAAEVLRANRAAAKRASEARNLILSVEKGTPRRVAIRLLYAAFADWRKVHAPNRAWVAAIHFYQRAYHLHAAIVNVGPDGQSLKYKPHQVVEMSEIKFTDLAISAHGTSKKGLPVYTKARGRLLVQDLADLLVSSAGDIEDDVWQCLETPGPSPTFAAARTGLVQHSPQ